MTAERVLPYYRQHIERRVLKGDAVLVSAHGNSLRALVMALEGLSGEEIVKRELATGVPLVYRLTAEGKVESYRELAA
jgi:2,3-bisphosphoglycerate-dependent phosphoglycerate mutase